MLPRDPATLKKWVAVLAIILSMTMGPAAYGRFMQFIGVASQIMQPSDVQSP